MKEVLEALTRDVSSGHLHKRWRLEGTTAWMTYEACNLDAAGGYEVVDDSAIADVPHEALCKRCFAEPAD